MAVGDADYREASRPNSYVPTPVSFSSTSSENVIRNNRGGSNIPAAMTQADIDAAVQARLDAITAAQEASMRGRFNTQVGNLSDQLLGLTDEGDVAQGLQSIFSQAGRTGEAGNLLLDIGTGARRDPRFEGLRSRTLQEQGNVLSRRGFGGSSAALNQLGRVQQDLNLQELSSRDRALGLGSSLIGQSAGLTERGITGRTAGIETMSLPMQIEIARTAAANAGKGGDSGGGGKK